MPLSVNINGLLGFTMWAEVFASELAMALTSLLFVVVDETVGGTSQSWIMSAASRIEQLAMIETKSKTVPPIFPCRAAAQEVD